MRPIFTAVFHGNLQQLLASVKEELNEKQCPCAGQVFRQDVVLWICDAQRHFWSPYLYLRFEPGLESDDDFIVHGRFAPHPHVWTLFMAIYGILSLTALGGIIWGASQQMLGDQAWGYFIVPAAIFSIAFVYGAVFIGQGLGAEQMYQLRSFLDRCLGDTDRT